LTRLVGKDFQETGYGDLFFIFKCIFWLTHSGNGGGLGNRYSNAVVCFAVR
jgi:hypothetical protein